MPGSIRLLFQPSEEAQDAEGKSGAMRMVEEGALDALDAVFGLHVSPIHEVGTVATRSGPITAAADEFTLTVIGSGGHAAHPHAAVDPIVLAAPLHIDDRSAVERLAAELGIADRVIALEERKGQAAVVQGEESVGGQRAACRLLMVPVDTGSARYPAWLVFARELSSPRFDTFAAVGGQVQSLRLARRLMREFDADTGHLSRRGLRVVTILVNPASFYGRQSAEPLYQLLRAGGQVAYLVNNGDDLTTALSRGATEAGYFTV